MRPGIGAVASVTVFVRQTFAISSGQHALEIGASSEALNVSNTADRLIVGVLRGRFLLSFCTARDVFAFRSNNFRPALLHRMQVLRGSAAETDITMPQGHSKTGIAPLRSRFQRLQSLSKVDEPRPKCS